MEERHIDADEEILIQSLVEDHITKLKDEDMRTIESKLGELVSQSMEGETWICKVEKQQSLLKWFEKPQNHHLNKKTLDFNKKLLLEQA